MLEKDFKSAVKSVLGTCASIGILVENKNPNELIIDVAQGKYDKEIKSQISETNSEKRTKLDDYFAQIKHTQDMKIEAAKKAAEAAEAAKAETAATAAAEPGKAATATASASPTAAKAAPAKKEEKKK